MSRPNRGRRSDSRHRGETTLVSMKANQLVEVDVRDTIAISHHERLTVEVLAHPLQSPCRLRGHAGVHERDSPLVADALQWLDGVVGEVDGDVGSHVERFGEVLLDVLALVSEADDELLMPEVGEVTHDVPQDRPVADLDHRFGPDIGLLADTTAHTARQDHDLHCCDHARRTCRRKLTCAPRSAANTQLAPTTGASPCRIHSPAVWRTNSKPANLST